MCLVICNYKTELGVNRLSLAIYNDKTDLSFERKKYNNKDGNIQWQDWAW